MRGGRFFCVALPLILCLAAIIALLYGVLAGVAHRRLYMFSIDISELSIDPSKAQEFLGDVKDLTNGNAIDEIKEKVADKLPDNPTSEEVKDTIEDALPEGTDIDKLGLDNLDLENLNLDQIDDKIDDKLNDINLNDLDLGDVFSNNKRRSVEARQQATGNNITAKSLGLGDKYEVSLWGYCRVNSNGKRNCTDAKWDWAESHFDTSFLDDIAEQTGLNITLPDEIHDALEVFKPVSKWTQIGFAISLIALGIELVIGIFANCTRVISCLVWLWAGIATTLVIATSALATVTATVVVGAVEATGDKYGADGRINTNFLATIWIGAAFSIAAGLFWIFTICCCKPESRSERNQRKRMSDGEKLLPGNQSGSYGQLHDDNEMRGGLGAQPSPGFSPGFAPGYNNAPQYPRNARSDLAYEPYSNRA